MITKQKIKKIYYNGFSNLSEKIYFSFEFFPPKNIENDIQLEVIAKKLSEYEPSFFSITYSPIHKNRYRTQNMALKIQKITNIPTAAHLTCTEISQEDLITIIKNYWKNGIHNIVALRGDIINKNFNQNQMYAIDLVKLLKNIANFDITVAAYPEMHPEAISKKQDLLFLKQKIEAGANRAITQFFFDVDKYLYFREQCIKIGITKNIIPGILPIKNLLQLKKFSKLTNVHIPKDIHEIFNTKNNNNNEYNNIIGSIFTFCIIKKLYQEGVRHFHFYTLNDFITITAMCNLLKNINAIN
ncbi:5,10-methylenetetrahydrofolate reductase [Buchnera aphidicola (Thelaxes californica)]|uniref:Methylenetetrahydrofolate reductase n=1 Tax=Buchnera aphidicola (Thelaxes californica) TaxID=1315998 RepID=A0A4D6YNH6_9GAMM|nr:methylenetetrahydrofolate reductase [Buchnera aphidicola]QCI26595.1 5,10-methylenetetrahydrofolate reductase [Buchnera aphidicola (Thelaxes californica)]